MASHQWSEYFEGMNSISAVLNSRSRSRSFESLVSPVASVASSQVTLCTTSGSSWVDVNGNQMMTIFLNYDGNERSFDVKCDDTVSFSVESFYEYHDGYGFDIDVWELFHESGEPIDHNLTWDDNGVKAGEVICMETVFDRESSDDERPNPIVVNLHFPFTGERMNVEFDTKDTIGDVIHFCLQLNFFQGLTSTDNNPFRIFKGGTELNDENLKLNEVFGIDVPDDRMFFELKVTIRARSGARGGVIKKHVKQEQKMKELVEKSTSLITRQYGTAEASGETPNALRPVLQPLVDTMNQIRIKMNNDEDVLAQGLNFLTDEQLDLVRTIFDQSKSIKTEVKLFQTAHAMMKELEVLDVYVEHIKKLKHEAVVCFIEAYAQKYSHTSANGSLEYANERFKAVINEAISYRRGIRRAVATDGAEVEDGSNQDASNRCVMM